MAKIFQYLDPIVIIGVIISVATSIILVLTGNDEVSSLLVGLLITIIGLILDVISRLKEVEKNLLNSVPLGDLLIDNPELHKQIKQIVYSYQSTQNCNFDLFIERSKDALSECREILSSLEHGYTWVEAGGKYSYGRRGTREAQTNVLAVAYEDIPSWRTNHLKDVIQVNNEAIKRGINIKRVFILKDENLDSARDILEAHKSAGVEVFIVSPSDLPTTQLLESFMIVDNKTLIVFYYTRDGSLFREEKVSIEPVEVDRALAMFNSIFRRAKPYISQNNPVLE